MIITTNYNQDKRQSTLLIILILASVATLAFFSSCSAVKKSVSKTKEQTDSVSVVKKEAAEVIKTDSVSVKHEEGNYEKEFVYHYDTVYQEGKVVYVPRILKVYEKGNYQKDEMATHSNYDSAVSKEIDSAMKKQTVETTVKQKKSSRLSLPFIIAAFVLAALIIFLTVIQKRKPSL